MINFIALYILMRRETQILETTQMLTTLAKLAVASAVLAALCWVGDHWLLAGWSHMALLTRIASLSLVIGVAGAAFFAAALALRVGELEDLTKLIKRKLGRR